MSDLRGQTAPDDFTGFYGGSISTLPVMDSYEDLPDPPQPTLSELWSAGVTLQEARNTTGEMRRVRDAYAPILEELNKGQGFFGDFTNPGEWNGDGADRPLFGSNRTTQRERDEARIWAEIRRRRETDPNFLSGIPATIEEFHAQILAKEQKRREEASATISRNRTTMGAIAGFAGGMAESFDDPLVIATLPIGGAGKTIAQRIVTEGLAQMGLQALLEPQVVKNLADLGETMTAGDIALDIGSAGVAGAGFQGLIAEPVSALLRRFLNTVPVEQMTDAERAAVNVLEREGQVTETSPFTPGAGTEAHGQRLETSMKAILDSLPGSAAKPSVRAELQSGTSLGSGTVGRPVEVPRVEVVGTAARTEFKRRVHRAEAGGGDDYNEASGAMGPYQFLASTWTRYYLRRYGRNGKTDAQIAALRRDPALNEQLMDDLVADNAAALRRIGARETAGNLYLLHFAGEGGGTAILRAAPDTPIERLLSPLAIEKNPFLRGKTAADVVEWAHTRMGENVNSAPTVRRDLFPDDDAGDAEWLRAQRESDLAELDAERARRASDFEPEPSENLRQRAGQIDSDSEPFGSNWMPSHYQSAVVERTVPHLAAAREAASEFVGKPLENIETGVSATVSRATLRKMTSESAVSKSSTPEDHALAVANVDKLYANALLDQSAPDVRGEPTIAAVHRYVAPMVNGEGKVVAVKMTVKETTGKDSPNPLYTVETIEVEGVKPARVAPLDGIERVPGQNRNTPQAGFGPNVVARIEEVKAGARDRRFQQGLADAWDEAVRAPPQRMAEAPDSPTAVSLAAYGDPVGAAARESAEGLSHDIQQSLDAGELGDIPFATEGAGEGALYQSARTVLADLEAEDSAIAALEACL